MQEPTESTQNGVDDDLNIKTISWSIFFAFAKKHWLALSITLLLIAAMTVAFFAIPVISINRLHFANLNAPITLHKGDEVHLKGQNTTAIVESFVVDTCPIKGKCYGNDMSSVEYLLIIDGVKYATASGVPAADSKYQIETINSDYATYVTLRIVESKK